MNKSLVYQKIRSYQGDNEFIISVRSRLVRWGKLTEKQLNAAEKFLMGKVENVNLDNLPEDIQSIVDYTGTNSFVKDIREKFMKYGTLTNNQVFAANRQIKKEQDKENTIRVNWPTVGETIKVGRKVGLGLKEKYELKFTPVLLDITSLRSVTPKAVLFTGKMTEKRGNVCVCCFRTLTDEFSMLTGMGKTCAKHMGVEYIKDKSEVERFRKEYMDKIEEIGEMEFWVPKSQIIKWDGVTEGILRAM